MSSQATLSRFALPSRCMSVVVLLPLVSILTGCVNWGVATMEPVDLSSKRYDADPLVEGIMNAHNQPLRAGEWIRVLTVDGHQLQFIFQSRNDTTLFLKKPEWFGFKKVDLPIDDVVFLESFRTGVVGGALGVWSMYPVVAEIDPADAGMSCSECERAILRADVLRKTINRQIAGAKFSTLGATMVLALKDVKSLVEITEKSTAARDAATARLIHLLRLWQAKGCSSATIGHDKGRVGQILAEFDKLTHEKQTPEADTKKLDKAIQKDP